MLVVASHQPTFLPWVGFWHKVVHSDVFVFSAGVKYSKSDVVSRVRLGNRWLSLPIQHATRSGLIRDVRFDIQVLPRIIKTLTFHFSHKLPGYERVLSVCDVLSKCKSDFLVDLNLNIIMSMAAALDRVPKFVVDFDSPPDLSDKTSRLFSRISRKISVDSYMYLAGRGALDYLCKDSVPAGVAVKVQKFDHRVDPGTALVLWANVSKPFVDVYHAGGFEDYVTV